ncbi:MAG: 3-phosphoshikimate 1-carboxyvinyltransferase [Pyrinomonadaceae bacterium]
MRISPARRLQGQISLPGDKSISHRAAIISALANGTSRITNFSPSQDCASTLSCLERLGVSIERSGDNVRVRGDRRLRPAEEGLDCGNSGSTIRMLAGVLAGQNFSSTLTGDDSLRSRPMKRIIEPLQMMGAEVKSRDGRPPLTIAGTSYLKPISYELPVASAQVKSCVLFAGLHAEGRTEIIERHGTTRDHTERMLSWFGVPLDRVVLNDNGATAVSLAGPVSLAAREISVPGDISSAAFLIAAAALLPGSNLGIMDVGLNPTRTVFLSLLRSLGLDVNVTEYREECNEPLGQVYVKGRLPATIKEGPHQIRGHHIAELIDELPLLAVVGTQIPGGIEIRDAAELRSKESDRISSTVKNLLAMGAEVEEFEDGLFVTGRTSLRGATINSYGDHRIAMAFTIAALLAAGDSEIEGAECVSVSFPEFFTILGSVAER